MIKYALGVFVVALIVRLWGLNAIGNTWDEYFYYDAAHGYATNLVKGDFNADHWKSNFEHPPIGKYVYIPALLWNKYHGSTPSTAYNAPRVISAVIGSLLVVLVFLIGTRYISLRVGLIASLIYSLLPSTLAYHKIINLDVTMTLFFIGAIGLLLEWLKTRNIKWLWLSVLVACLAVATKFNAVLIAIPIFGTVIITKWQTIRNKGLTAIPLPLFAFPFMAVAVLFATWPWLWSNTLNHAGLTLSHWNGNITEFFLATFVQAPKSYFLVHFIVATPILVLILFILGLYRLSSQSKAIAYVLVLWVLAPFLISFYHLKQDHIRYIIAAFPAVSLIAAIGFWWLTDHFAKAQKKLAPSAVIWLAIYLAFTAINAHPYYLDYYNEFIGGPKNVYSLNLFTLGFYGEGIKQATEYINKTAIDGATVHYEIIPDDIPYLDRSRLSRLDTTEAQYLVFNSNALQDAKKRLAIDTTYYQEVYAVRVLGAPFVWVYKKMQD